MFRVYSTDASRPALSESTLADVALDVSEHLGEIDVSLFILPVIVGPLPGRLGFHEVGKCVL
jgi:hypothetical protein